MERNHIIGILLIIAVLFIWNQYFFQPEMEQQRRKMHEQDSIAQLEKKEMTAELPTPSEPTTATNEVRQDSLSKISSDSVISIPEQLISLENGLVKITLSSKGAAIKDALIKNHYKMIHDSVAGDHKEPLHLLEDPKNRFELKMPFDGRELSTHDLMFEVQQESPLVVRFIAKLSESARLIQTYRLQQDNYELDYTIQTEGWIPSAPVKINWENYLDKLERNEAYERLNSTVYFKEIQGNTDYCSCRSNDKIESKEKKIKWVSNSNQFFNSTLIAATGFQNASYETIGTAPDSPDLKKLSSMMEIAPEDFKPGPVKMSWYIGPNEYKRLAAFNEDLQSIIPYGWSIFGTVNRYAIRPMFSFLNGLVGSKGIIILLMTLFVKLLVFPLAYKMLHSQAKMTALKPEIDKLKSKYKDDMQKQQMETMKIYNEFGVNPLGGCFPLLLQMPIWIALYRFFPASIEFRQESFLWATDLTSFDEFLRLPFSLPLFGNTISLFAFLWMISTLAFSYYSSKSMDFSANPAMKYMQYLMPVIFWFMFNKTAAGLTCYMFFSNLLNIAQTVLGKRFLFDDEKIRFELEKNKSKPKKQGGFRDRLEQMMKEQQRIQQEKSKQPKK